MVVVVRVTGEGERLKEGGETREERVCWFDR